MTLGFVNDQEAKPAVAWAHFPSFPSSVVCSLSGRWRTDQSYQTSLLVLHYSLAPATAPRNHEPLYRPMSPSLVLQPRLDHPIPVYWGRITAQERSYVYPLSQRTNESDRPLYSAQAGLMPANPSPPNSTAGHAMATTDEPGEALSSVICQIGVLRVDCQVPIRRWQESMVGDGSVCPRAGPGSWARTGGDNPSECRDPLSARQHDGKWDLRPCSPSHGRLLV